MPRPACFAHRGVSDLKKMITTEINICGKHVMAGYCYATEIAFNNYTGVPVEKFDAERPEHVVYLIMAAIFAYYNAEAHATETHELTDEAMLYEAKPDEILNAFKAVMELRAQWYGVGTADEIGKTKEDQGDPEKN